MTSSRRHTESTSQHEIQRVLGWILKNKWICFYFVISCCFFVKLACLSRRDAPLSTADQFKRNVRVAIMALRPGILPPIVRFRGGPWFYKREIKSVTNVFWIHTNVFVTPRHRVCIFSSELRVHFKVALVVCSGGSGLVTGPICARAVPAAPAINKVPVGRRLDD